MEREYEEEEEFEPEGEYNLDDDILNSDFVGDIIARVKHHVDSFFQDKPMCCGGPIPKHLLHSPDRISKVMNTSISNGIDQAYVALEKTIDPKELQKAEQFGYVTDDIKLVSEVLDKLAQHKVPKCFAGGILLMYLEYCEGIEM